MTEPDDKQMRETAWRRQLTPAETVELEAFLATHPDNREDWDLELELNRALEQLPAAPPVASNFTSLVMQEVERERRNKARRSIWPRWLTGLGWMPRAVAAMLVGGVTCGTYLQYQARARAEMAGDVAQVTEIMSATDPVVMANYDAIQRMGGDRQPQVDAELLVLFAK